MKEYFEKEREKLRQQDFEIAERVRLEREGQPIIVKSDRETALERILTATKSSDKARMIHHSQILSQIHLRIQCHFHLN